jgi:hypothetical protein
VVPRRDAAGGAAALIATLVGCAPAESPAARPMRVLGPRVTKPMVFVVENHSIQQAQAAHSRSLLQAFGLG